MKTLYYGGSFNPVGNHHLLLAQLAMEAGGYDRVVLIPCASPPHKPSGSLLSHFDRHEMCRIATGWHGSRMDVSEIEQVLVTRHGRKNYTIDTVRELKSQGERDVHLLIGTDSLLDLRNWHECQHLICAATFVVAPRHDEDVRTDHFTDAEKKALKLRVCQTPLIDVSSTLIRQRRREGKSIRYMVPRGVEEYIVQNGLYKE